MLRQVGIRTLFLLGSLGALAIAVGFALYAAPELIRSHLSGDVSDRTLEEAVAAARQAILLGGALAAAAAVLFSFGLGTAVAQAMRRVRYAAVRVLDAPSRRSMPSFALLELDMLAGTLGRIASDLDRRLRGIRRERDEATRLLDSVGEGILQLTEDGRIVRVNRTAIELLGLPEDQEVRERPVVSFVRHPALREMLTRAAAGDAVPSREVRLDDRRVLVLANPLRGGTGRAGAVAVFVDLTELRRLEGVRRDFVANASHELKTPLTSLRGYSETLLQDDVPEELRRQFLESIHHNADRLHRIVEDLLDLSRLESGRWEPDYEPVDPAAVAEDVWHGFAERAEAAGVAFDVERDYDDPVPADRVALAQIFSNLYDNALRHTPEGGRIRVRVARADRADVHATAAIAGRVDPAARGAGRYAGPRPERRRQGKGGAAFGTVAAGRRTAFDGATAGECVLIEVADTGGGIPSDAIDRIFERFYRVDPARSRAEGGTGLGLAIVRHMVESMGGAIRAASELGKGTTMRIVLPASRPERDVQSDAGGEPVR